MDNLHQTVDVYHALVNNIPDISILVFDACLRCQLAKGQIFVGLGVIEEQVVGKPVQEVIGLSNSDKLLNACQAALNGVESDLQWATGTAVYQLRILPVRHQQSESITAGLVVLKDISAEERGEEKFNFLLESAPDAMVIIDHRGEIVLINAQTEKLFGYTRAELLGQPVEMLMPGRFEDVHINYLTKYIKNPQVRSMGSGLDLYGVRKDGSEFSVDISLSPLNIEDGPVVIGAIRDMTERKQAELALKEARDQLEIRVKERTAELQVRNEELDAFAQIVAHDLKSPLTFILGMAGLLYQHFNTLDEGETQEFLESILQQSRKMDSIISELLVLSSVRHVKQPPAEAVNMNAVVAEVEKRVGYLIKEHNAELIIPSQWPVAIGHSPWIEAVWVNYISNAIKYGGHPPVVELGATPQADGIVRFWVRDNGAGLAPDEQKKLFMAFTQLNKIRVDGHGLGLSIVLRMVEKMGGQVGVESEIDKGSVFFFALPSA